MNRAALTAEILKLIIGKYPVSWSAAELALAVSAGRRSVERIIVSLMNAGLIEKRHGTYRMHSAIIDQFYGAQWYVRQERDKDIKLASRRSS